MDVDPYDDTRTSTDGKSDDASARLSAGATIGRYQVRGVLGAGGMGVVYRAYDPELGRELAIKVVTPGTTSGKAQDRLLDEARAMAKLRHAHIVPVFDVGSTAAGVYIVMPLYSGGTLHDWLHGQKRPWREVVDRFVAAGQGLAAAHAAGLIHRDFKPKNVFLGDAGEPLVGDFGLAAPTASLPGDPTTSGTATTSTIAGTPAYMAPEQAQGAVLDARADQYAYCISFWEGLCGQRPTEAETRTEGPLAFARPLLDGRERGAPAWLLTAVARGFAAMPERRWPSIDALLTYIARRRRRRTRVAIGSGAGVLAVGIGALVLLRPASGAAPCPDPLPKLATIWSEPVKAELSRAFLATGLPYAQDTLDRIVPALDRYAGEWRSKQLTYCRAGRVEKTESAVLLDARMGCLERRLAALRGRTEAFRQSPAETLAKAVDAVESLPAIADCDDRDRVTAYPAPASKAARASIEVVERQLDTLEAQAATGIAPQDRAAQLERLVAEARTLAYPPSLARTLNQRASALIAAGEPAEAAARELIQVAAAAHDDVRVLHGWKLLLRDLIERQGKLADAKALEPAAEAALTRAGTEPGEAAGLKNIQAGRAMRADELDLALRLAQEAVDASPPTQRATSLENLAAVLSTMGRAKDAIAPLEEAVGLFESSLGGAHPDVATAMSSLARQVVQLGDLDRGTALLQRALLILEAALGPDHPYVGDTLRTLGNVEKAKGNFGDAMRHLRRAVEILEKGTDRRTLAVNLGALATLTRRVEGLGAARPLFERSLALFEELVGRDHSSYVMVEFNLASALFADGDGEGARVLFLHAQRVYESQGLLGQAAAAKAMLASCDVMTKHLDRAIAPLEEVVSYCAVSECPFQILDAARLNLGVVLYETGNDPRRGRALVVQARAACAKTGDVARLKAADAWLASHPRRR